jgi:hypothetical protein
LAQKVPQHVWPVWQSVVPPQLPRQVPPEHVSPGAHALPQVPQLFGSTAVLISQPSLVRPSQSAKLGAHFAMLHVAPRHWLTAFGHGPQNMLQPPQLFGSLDSSTQMGSQQLRPGPHEAPPPQTPTQWKFEQTWLGPHWVSLVHSTQVCVSSRQCGVGNMQSASLLQPVWTGTHVCVVGSHASPLGHVSGSVRQATHCPGGISQNGVEGVAAQSLFDEQPTGGAPPFAVVSPTGVRPQPARRLAAAR